MANINVTPGTGKTVSTDSVGGVEYQYIKIIDGTAGANTNVAAVSANGLDVDVKASVLPSGASTSAKQPALGIAGTASTDVITVQGIASMTALKVDGSAVTQPVSGTVTANIGTSGSLNLEATQTAMSAKLPATLGQKAMTASMAVVLASDQSSVPVAATLTAETTKVIGTTRTLGNAGAIIDGVNTAATAPANGVLGLGIYNSTEPSPTTGQSVGIQLDAKGRQRGVIMDAAGNTRGANVDASNRLSVTVDNVSATNISTNMAQVGGTNVVTGGTNGSQAIGGIQAHDAADSGNNPVKIGAKATSSEPTAVSSGDIANLITDLVGKLIVLPYANPENFVSGAITTAMTGTTSTSLIAAPAAGLRNYITQITVSNAHATVGTDVIIQDGSGGTTLYTIPAAAVYGGATITFPVPLRQPTTATAIYCANVTTGASTKVSASGYKGA